MSGRPGTHRPPLLLCRLMAREQTICGHFSGRLSMSGIQLKAHPIFNISARRSGSRSGRRYHCHRFLLCPFRVHRRIARVLMSPTFADSVRSPRPSPSYRGKIDLTVTGIKPGFRRRRHGVIHHGQAPRGPQPRIRLLPRSGTEAVGLQKAGGASLGRHVQERSQT